MKYFCQVKFSHLSRNMTMQRHLKLYKLADSTKTPGIREFRTTDVGAVTKLLNTYLEQFDLTPIFTEVTRSDEKIFVSIIKIISG